MLLLAWGQRDWRARIKFLTDERDDEGDRQREVRGKTPSIFLWCQFVPNFTFLKFLKGHFTDLKS